jgi:hypothetical protein
MQPFTPWAWRDPAVLAGGYGRTDDPAGHDPAGHDSAGYDPAGHDSAGYDPAGYDPAGQTRAESVREDARAANPDLIGYGVEAADGSIGSIDEASHEIGASLLIVDTGPWIFGRKVLLPAGTVQRVDHAERKVYVDRTKRQIKDSPEYDPDTFGKPTYRERVGSYYEDSYHTEPRLR